MDSYFANVILFIYFTIMSEEKTLSAASQKIMDAVEKLTIVELADLVSAMEEKFGVSAAAPVAVAGGDAGGDAGAEDEQSEFTIVLKETGGQKIAVIKAIREITGLGLGEAKGIADNGGPVKEGVGKEDAEKAKKLLEDAGATVELQ